jgi:hypothetical protein
MAPATGRRAIKPNAIPASTNPAKYALRNTAADGASLKCNWAKAQANNRAATHSAATTTNIRRIEN